MQFSLQGPRFAAGMRIFYVFENTFYLRFHIAVIIPNECFYYPYLFKDNIIQQLWRYIGKVKAFSCL